MDCRGFGGAFYMGAQSLSVNLEWQSCVYRPRAKGPPRLPMTMD
jgi:hypothetical protein